MRKISEAIVQILLFLLALIFILIVLVSTGVAEPTGVTLVSNTTDTGPVFDAANSSAEGGTITTLLINVTQQSISWKGYVGNITGQLVLQDSDNYTLYNWSFASLTGEVYASRSDNPTWANINCTNTSMKEAEDTTLGIPADDVDSINHTFVETIHKNVSVGAVEIDNSTCPALVSHVAGSSQALDEDAKFQEILLDDTTNLVYVNILEQDEQGYNEENYDFQFILPDSYSTETSTTYYFWAELV